MLSVHFTPDKVYGFRKEEKTQLLHGYYAIMTIPQLTGHRNLRSMFLCHCTTC